MHLTFTEQAVQRIEAKLGAPDGRYRLKLVYDSEGCGCAVSGMAQLWVVDGPQPDDRQAESEAFPVLYEPRHEVFFDETMTVDYPEGKRNFVLKSKGQIYNPMMNLIDKRSSTGV